MKRLYIILATILLCGCFQDEEYSTLIYVTTAEQAESGGDFTPLDGTLTHLFAPTIEGYTFESYADALQGVATDVETGAASNAIATVPCEDDLMRVQVDGEQFAFLVVVDTINECYAYCNYEVGLNLKETFITVSFRPWKSGAFEQGDWIFVNPIIEEEEETTEE